MCWLDTDESELAEAASQLLAETLDWIEEHGAGKRDKFVSLLSKRIGRWASKKNGPSPEAQRMAAELLAASAGEPMRSQHGQ